LTAGRKGTLRAPSPQRGENGRAEKIRGRGTKKTGKEGDMAERRRSPERFGQTFRGRPRHYHRTTTTQELDKDLSAVLISSF